MRGVRGHPATTKEGKTFVGPGEGARLPVLDITHKVTAEDLGGSLTVEEWGLPPGMMIPPHTHAREDECSYVLEGELTYYVGAEVAVAPKGSYVIKARGVPHAFYNAGPETVRVVMEVLTPGGFDGYFDEYEDIVSKLASGEIDEGEQEGSGRTRRTLRGRLARRAHPRGQGPLRHRPLASAPGCPPRPSSHRATGPSPDSVRPSARRSRVGSPMSAPACSPSGGSWPRRRTPRLSSTGARGPCTSAGCGLSTRRCALLPNASAASRSRVA
jgi:quercetin dioxygenase-like cupin family protein